MLLIKYILMKILSLQGKTNFFEKRLIVSNQIHINDDNKQFIIDDDL